MQGTATRFLVTGLPRCRSAWLAALLTANGSPCVHEIPVIFGRIPRLEEVFEAGYHGIADPSVLGIYGDAVLSLRGIPTAVIRRSSYDSRKSLEAWLGQTVPHWEMLESALKAFEGAFNPLIVPYDDLNSFDAVNALVQDLTGRPLVRRVFDLLNFLKVEQHQEKARAAVGAIR